MSSSLAPNVLLRLWDTSCMASGSALLNAQNKILRLRESRNSMRKGLSLITKKRMRTMGMEKLICEYIVNTA